MNKRKPRGRARESECKSQTYRTVPVKRHRGEPGHTRDTHGTRGRTRAHGTHRQTSQPSKPNDTPARPRDGRNRGRLSIRRAGPEPTAPRGRLCTGTGTGKKTPGGAGTTGKLMHTLLFNTTRIAQNDLSRPVARMPLSHLLSDPGRRERVCVLRRNA